ncbi:VOC family protein [Virgibacillus halodenitrificans]|uniref:VOC family protein n=1 Tax=Virgibacillus halodenitrificans TaxID=1482 RepID=UPI00036FC37C|nr:VOC family protein [Virgibacillus halodenitrificans]
MNFQYNKIDHVQLAAPKGGEEKAKEFYIKKLGFTELEKPPLLKKNGGAWFRAGDVHIHIGIEDPFRPATKAHPAIQVHQLESLKKHLTDQGIEVITDDRLPGASRFYVNDPFGNRIEFLEWISSEQG